MKDTDKLAVKRSSKKQIVKGLNEIIDVPLIGENMEYMAITEVFDLAMEHLNQVIPKGIVSIITSTGAGIIGDEMTIQKLSIKSLKEADKVVQKHGIWWLPDETEKKVVSTLLLVIMYYSREGLDINNVDGDEMGDIETIMRAHLENIS